MPVEPRPPSRPHLVRRTISSGPALLLLLSGLLLVPASAQSQESTVVYLVRHAEKAADDPNDPTLTPAGFARAERLTRVLGDAGITSILSTSFQRTRLTVAPLAESLGLTVEEYDGSDLESVAARIRTIPGRYLISGHSDTTPELVGLLGGDPGSPIDEPTEYDRLYVVVILPDGTATSTLLRYGEAAM